jgi:hypothetical protein
MLELGTGISTGLSPWFLIIWAISKGLSYLGMMLNRVIFLRRVYYFAGDLPRFCDIPHTGQPDPEEPSPEEALEVLKLMLSDSKHSRMSKFDTDDLKSMRQLWESLKERASQEIALGGKRGDDRIEGLAKHPLGGNNVSVSVI